MQFLNIPKVQLSILLLLIYLSALKTYPNTTSLYLIIASLSFCVISDLLFTYIRKKTFFVPFGAIATSLIISLIVDTNVDLWQLATICFLAMASKNFLRISNIQIFNPAGFGLLAGGLVLNLPVSWWGVSFQNFQFSIFNFQTLWPFLILISPMFVSAYRMRKYVSILAFLLTYSLILRSPLILFDSTTLFFALVMIPEPMSSPFSVKRQVMYGVLIGVLAYLLSVSHIAGLLPDALIPALLLGNLIFFKFK